MHLIGIKSSIRKEEIKNKLKVKPKLLELFLTTKDLDVAKLENRINYILKLRSNIKISLHSPVSILTKNTISLMSNKIFLFLDVCVKLIEKFNNEKNIIIAIILHPDSIFNFMSRRNILDKNIIKLKKKYHILIEYIYFENLPTKLLTPFENFLSILKEHNLNNICFDMAHFTGFNSEENLLKILGKLKGSYNLYFHISDNFYNSKNTKPLNIGLGEINFKPLKKYIELGILETKSNPEVIGKEITEDYIKLIKIFND